MLIRVIVLLLLVLNLGAAAWIASTYSHPVSPASPVPEEAAGVSRLMLLSEREPESPRPAAAAVSSSEGEDICETLGPFSNQAELRLAMTVLTPLTHRIQFRDANRVQSRGWWVYLPPFSTRELALETARELTSRGISDYYVISAGDQQNTISLGLFRERANAEHRQAELAALNFNPVLGERNEDSRVYWIDYARPSASRIDAIALIAATDELSQTAISCF